MRFIFSLLAVYGRASKAFSWTRQTWFEYFIFARENRAAVFRNPILVTKTTLVRVYLPIHVNQLVSVYEKCIVKTRCVRGTVFSFFFSTGTAMVSSVCSEIFHIYFRTYGCTSATKKNVYIYIIIIVIPSSQLKDLGPTFYILPPQ